MSADDADKKGLYFHHVSYMFKQTPAYLPRHDLLIDLNWLICKEWRVASCHFIDEDTEGPPVHSFVIALKRFKTDSTERTQQQNLCYSQNLKGHA